MWSSLKPSAGVISLDSSSEDEENRRDLARAAEDLRPARGRQKEPRRDCCHSKPRRRSSPMQHTSSRQEEQSWSALRAREVGSTHRPRHLPRRRRSLCHGRAWSTCFCRAVRLLRSLQPGGPRTTAPRRTRSPNSSAATARTRRTCRGFGSPRSDRQGHRRELPTQNEACSRQKEPGSSKATGSWPVQKKKVLSPSIIS